MEKLKPCPFCGCDELIDTPHERAGITYVCCVQCEAEGPVDKTYTWNHRTLREETMEPERLARLFHDTYEELAPEYGWETQQQSRVDFDSLPEPNRSLMIETCKRALKAMMEG